MENEVPITCSWQTGHGNKKHLKTYAKEPSRVCIWEPCEQQAGLLPSEGRREPWHFASLVFPTLDGVSSDSAVAMRCPQLSFQSVERGIGAIFP